MKYLFSILMMLSLIIIACDKQEPSKYFGSNVALSFSKKLLNNGLILSWEQRNNNSFVEYIVTKNSKSTPAFKRILDIDSGTILSRSSIATNVIDSTIAFSAYYRLYVVFESQLIASEEIFHQVDNYVLSGTDLKQVLVDSRKGNLYVLYINGSAELLNFLNLKLIKFFPKNSFPGFGTCSLGYDKSGNTEIYVPDSTLIKFLDGDDLSIKNKVFNTYSNSTVKNTATDENSNIFFTDGTGFIVGGFSKYDAKTKSVIRFNFCECSNEGIIISKDGNRGLVGSFSEKLNQFTLNSKNDVIDFAEAQDIVSWRSNKLFVLSNKDQTMICGNFGTIFTGRFEAQKNLSNEVEGYVQSTFDQDENFIYAIGNSNRAIYKFENKLGYRKVASIPLKFYPNHIFVQSTYAYVIESVVDPNTGVKSSIIEKISI
jgi:hypothetical protein